MLVIKIISKTLLGRVTSIPTKHQREKTSDQRWQDGAMVKTNETHFDTRPTKFSSLIGMVSATIGKAITLSFMYSRCDKIIFHF